MHIKFLAHGQGSARGAVKYLLGERDHNGEERAEVTVLSGDPHLVAEVADASVNQWRYTSGVIAWSPEDNPTPEQINQVVRDFERTAFAGLDPDQYATCAVLHRETDGTAHIHTLTARVELSTGKALNIAPPGHEKTFDPLRDYWNHSQGWARPDDPERFRSVQPGHEAKPRSDDPRPKQDGEEAPENEEEMPELPPPRHPRTRQEITAHIEALAAEELITTGAEVRQELAEIGEITRASADYVSVRPHGEQRAIRLRGDLFRDNWTAEQTLDREARRAQEAAAGRDGQRDPDAADRARKRLEAATGRREVYHRERYQRPEPQLEPAAELSRGWATEADRTDREAPSHGSSTGRAVEPGGWPSKLDTFGSDRSGSDVSRGWRDSGRFDHSRPSDRQPFAAAGDSSARDSASRTAAEAGRSSGGEDDRWRDISDRGDMDRKNDRWTAGYRADEHKELSHDRTGNPAFEAVRAAAARLREASERAISTARTAAESAERAAGNIEPTAVRKPTAEAGGSATRSAKLENFQRSDAAMPGFVRAAREFWRQGQQVTTAYEAWMARQAERERQTNEQRQQTPERQQLPPRSRDSGLGM